VKITDLIISPESLGKRFWLVGVAPVYVYQNGLRTDAISGYRYTVALPDKKLDRLDVRIEGEKLMDEPDGYAEVRFDGLEVFIQWMQGDYRVAAKATGIHLVNSKA